VAAATDDAMLVEKAGGKVLIHPAPAENLKVTAPIDLRIAEVMLAERSG
jgi:2-C-methyl-D-erythritol 4-phosphate cytidylyltransferase